MYNTRLSIPFKLFCVCALLAVNIAASQTADAQVPSMVNYQGKIEMTGVPYNGPGYFKFSLIDNTSSPAVNYWTNDGSIVAAGTAPAGAVSLPVTLGLFTVRLGDTNLGNMTSLATSVFANSTMYLRVWFSADGMVFEQLVPDRQLASAPFAMRAETANRVEGTDVVSTSEITDNTITNADISASASISASKIDTTSATNLVSKIIAGSGVSLSPVTGVGDVTITVTGSGAASDVVCTNCVESSDITDGTITTGDLAFDPIEETELDTKAELEAQLTDVSDIAMADGDVFSGAHDFGGATSLEIPNSAAPVTDAAGEIALDTSITDHQPLLQYFDGTKNMSVIAIDTAELPALDNEIIKYDAATDKFVLEADAGGGGSGDVTDVGDCTTGECFTSAATNPGALYFEGTTNDGIEVILQAADATVSDKTITLPDATGTVTVSASAPLALSVAGDVSLGTVDISDNTNLAVSAPITRTDDTIGITQHAGTDVTADLEEEGQINTTAVTGDATVATGQVLRSTGANAAAWGALDLADTDAVTNSLPVANGGTGAANAADARTNLGAAASGANSDITSLASLSTALSVAQGGTGSTTAAGARTSLGAAASGANADITSTTALTSITRATGGAFNINIGSAAGDDFAVDTDKLVVEGDTGNVGIGTATPNNILDVFGVSPPNSERTFTDGNSSRTVLSLRRSNSSGAGADNIGAHIDIWAETETDGTNAPIAQFKAIATDATAGTIDSDVYILPYANSIIVPEALVVKSTGDVGIGTAAPNSSLHITPATAAALQIDPFNTGAGNTGEIRWLELAAGGTNYIGFKAPDALAGDVIWTLPNADGTNGQVLKTDGAGILTWAADSTGGTPSFDTVATGTNTTATMTVGTGGTLTTSGSGVLDANQFKGNATVAVADGGTGGTTASAARTNLGLAIDSDVQGYDAGLASIAGLTTAADKMIYTTGADTYAVIDLSAFARSVLDDANAGAARTTLGAAASGANSDITSLASLSTALSVAQGGTGSTTAAGARTSLGAAASGANGDITGLSALTSLKIPASTAPSLTVDGQVGLETDADAVNIQAGSNTVGGIPANTVVALPLVQQKDITLLEPDQIQTVSDAIPFFTVDAYNYPNGITITAIRLATDASSSLTINVEEWTSPTDGSPATVDSIATSASSEVTETTITDASIAAGSYVFLDLDTTDVNWAKVTIWYYVND